MPHPSQHVATHPDKIAYRIADGDETLTYRELDDASNQAAQLFRSLGIGIGDHIAILMENRLELLVLCWGAQRAGLYCTPISTHLRPGEVSYVVGNCGAKLLVVGAGQADMAGAILPDLPESLHRLAVGGDIPGFGSYEEAANAMPPRPIADERAGYIMNYSSGTTGRPKGIKPVFRDVPIDTVGELQLALCRDVSGLGPDAIYLSPAPLYHAAPLLFSMMTVALGGTVVIERRFDAESFLRHVEQYGITHSQLVPTMFVRMLKLPAETRARYNLASLRIAVHAAAPCPIQVKRDMISWWGPILVEYYGATEAYGFTMVDSPAWLAHPGTVGRAVVGKLRIVGEDGVLQPPGEIGTVYFEDGPRFSYHEEPEKTAAAYNAQGWATVGDVGYVDAEGFLYLTDRKAYVINSGGVNVYPQACEDLLASHPKVLDAAVFGVPDEDMGEVVKAVVQPLPGVDAGEELERELIAHCRAELASIACPRSIDFTDELPRTPTGKLNKRLLRDQYWPQPAAGLTASGR